MSWHGNDSSFYAYTAEWIRAVDRGGLFVINDSKGPGGENKADTSTAPQATTTEQEGRPNY